MAADTSSSAAAITPVVGDAAAALAALIVEPTFAKSEAAAVTNSGAAITNTIPNLHRRATTRRSPSSGDRQALRKHAIVSRPLPTWGSSPPIGGCAIHPVHRLVGGQTPQNRAGIVIVSLADSPVIQGCPLRRPGRTRRTIAVTSWQASFRQTPKRAARPPNGPSLRSKSLPGWRTPSTRIETHEETTPTRGIDFGARRRTFG